MKYLALTECPQGQHPGDIFEAHEDAGQILVQVGCARVYVEPVDVEPPPAAEPVPSHRRTYRRRDLTAAEA